MELPLAFTAGWTSGIPAAIIAAVLLVVGVVVALLVLGRVRRGWSAFRRWWVARRAPAAGGVQ